MADPGGGGGSKGSKDPPPRPDHAVMNKLTNYMIDERLVNASKLINELAFDPKCVRVCVCVGGGGSKAKALQACSV